MKENNIKSNPIKANPLKANPMEADFLRFLFGNMTQVPDYLLSSYQQLGLSERGLIDLLRVLACCDKGGAYVRFERLLRQWQGQEPELRAALAALQQQGLLGKAALEPCECYKLDGLYEKLFELWVFQQSVPAGQGAAPAAEAAPEGQERAEVIKAAYQLFEGEFARPLSPLEMERLNCWLTADSWPIALLREAVQRAVMHGALSFAYVDKILLRWQKEGINTLEKLVEAEKKACSAPDKGQKTAPKGKKPGSTNRPAGEGFGSQTDYRKYFGV